MSTLKVDKIEPFSGGQVEITGLNVTGFATTGSNAFDGNQTITGSLTVSSSTEFDVDVTGRVKIQGPTSGQTPQLIVSGTNGNVTYGPASVGFRNSSGILKATLGENGMAINQNGQFQSDFFTSDSGVQWNFYSSSFDVDVTISSRTNLWSTEGNDSPGISMWNGSAYVVPIQFRDGTNWGDGTTTFNVPLDIKGGLTVSSSREFDVDVTGRVKIQGPTTGQIPNLTISGSDFFTEHNRFGSTYNKNGQLTYGVQVGNTSAYWVMYSSSFEEDVSFILKTSDFASDGIAAPGFVFWNGSDYVTPLQFKSGTNWGDGTTTFKTPLDISGSLRVSESVNISQVLTLKPLDPLPSADTGSLAVSGSNLYYYNGTTWSQIN